MATKSKTEVAGPMQTPYEGMPFTSKASQPKKSKGSKMKKSTMRKK